MTPPLPPSAVSQSTGLVGLVVFVVMLAVALASDTAFALIGLGGIALATLAMVAWDLATGRVRPRLQPATAGTPARVLTKLLGLALVLTVCATFYATLPLYRAEFYQPLQLLLFLPGAAWVIAGGLVLGAVYMVVADRLVADPYDEYWHFGRWLLTGGRDGDRGQLRHLGLVWLIKGFFLPLMASGFILTLADLHGHEWRSLQPMALFRSFFLAVFLLDIAFSFLGYVMTAKALDAHIRSTQPRLDGWLVAIICYYPFWRVISANFLAYEDEVTWTEWLGGLPWLQAIWGAAIVACLVVYAWATMTFGYRFSNLTHRGILTNGPYRWTKHPAYWSKNLSWWLIAVPFAPHGSLWGAVGDSLMLAGVSAIYVLRARSEERHLSEDPVYRDYAAWIERYGLVSRLKRLLGLARPPLPSDSRILR